MKIFQRPPGKLVAEAGAGIVWFQGSSSGHGTASRGYEELWSGNQNHTRSRAPGEDRGNALGFKDTENRELNYYNTVAQEEKRT